jgi:hypothetical protein
LALFNRVGGIDLGTGGGSYSLPSRTPEEAEKVFQTAVEEAQRAGVKKTPKLKTHNTFISHAWAYNEDYYRLVKMLNEAPDFGWKNYSVPEHDPLHQRTKKDLEQALYDQIRSTSVVIVLAGMYVTHREWIQKEIDIALEMNKPIIGIRPWGSERIPRDLQDVAKEIVGWNTSSIVTAIKRWARAQE